MKNVLKYSRQLIAVIISFVSGSILTNSEEYQTGLFVNNPTFYPRYVELGENGSFKSYFKSGPIRECGTYYLKGDSLFVNIEYHICNTNKNPNYSIGDTIRNFDINEDPPIRLMKLHNDTLADLTDYTDYRNNMLDSFIKDFNIDTTIYGQKNFEATFPKAEDFKFKYIRVKEKTE